MFGPRDVMHVRAAGADDYTQVRGTSSFRFMAGRASWINGCRKRFSVQ